VGSHLHCAPQAQTACCAACWQPHAQVEPLQLAQEQGACLTLFMIDFLWFVDDGMSSKSGLWSVARHLGSRLRRAALLDAATVSPVDRMVKQPRTGRAARTSTCPRPTCGRSAGTARMYARTRIVSPSSF